jgi:hypothetical protein
MKLFFTGCLLLAAVLNSCQSSCSNDTAKKLMGDWYKKKILFNKNTRLINNEQVEPRYAFDIYAPGAAFYVLHYFQADCDKCIYGLRQASDYINKTEKDHPGLRYAFIASGPTYVYAQEAVAKLNFRFPVYFDSIYQGFPKINHFPEGDVLYHTMLLNNKNEVELFGGYYSNPKAAELFSEIINCHQ